MKNKTTKKILSLILMACLLLGMMSGMNITATAAEGDVFTDNGLKFKVSGESGNAGAVMLIANDPIYTGTSYTIPQTVTKGGITYKVTEIDEYAFSGCTNLMNITVPANVTEIGNTSFYGCTNLVTINVENGNESYSSENGVLFNKDKTTLMLYPSKKTGNSYIIPATVTQVNSYSFQNCVNLASITFLTALPPIINADAFIGTGVLTVNVPIGKLSVYSPVLDGKLPNGSTIVDQAIITSVTWSGLTANGEANTIDTTELTFTFSVDPTSLAASNINVTGATKGELTGVGLTRKLAISNITVAEGANITVTISNPAGFTIYPSLKTIAVHKFLRQDQAPLIITALGAKTYGDSAFNLATEGGTTSGAVSYSIASAGDVISIIGNTVTILKAGTTTVTATMAGNATYNPVTSAPITITVSPKSVTAVATAENKAYDGSNSATLSSVTLTGIVIGDSAAVAASYSSATFADANVGNDKAVTITGILLTGSKAGNYILSSTTASTTANIIKAEQAVPALDFTITDTAGGFPKTVIITEVTGAEYKINDGEWDSLNNTHTSIIAENVTLYIRMKETTNYNESLTATLTINTGYENQTAPVAFTLINALNADNLTYSVTIPIIANAEYSFDGVNYSTVNTKIDCQPGSTVTGYAYFPGTAGFNPSPVTSSNTSVLIGLEIVTAISSLEHSKINHLLRLGVANCYSFSRLYQNFRLRKWQYVRYLNRADAVVMYFEFLTVYAVFLLGLVHFDMVYKLV